MALEVKTWPANTRLAKAVAANGLAIQCDTPNERQIKSWLAQHTKTLHQVRLDTAAADALLDLVPPELGILVQEIAADRLDSVIIEICFAAAREPRNGDHVPTDAGGIRRSARHAPSRKQQNLKSSAFTSLIAGEMTKGAPMMNEDRT